MADSLQPDPATWGRTAATLRDSRAQHDALRAALQDVWDAANWVRRVEAPRDDAAVRALAAQVWGVAGYLAASGLTQAAEAARRLDEAFARDGFEIDAQSPGAAAPESAPARDEFAWVEDCERFLATFDSTGRRRTGAYYTPRSLVRYLVAETLRRLPSSEGEWAWLDPAAGCGPFLLEAADQLAAAGMLTGATGDGPPAQLAGCELSPVSALVATWLLDRRHGAFAPRLQVGDALALRRLVEEGPLARRPAGLVVLGNPPYANYGRRERSPGIAELLRDYKQGLGERKQNLGDDYIQFLRWAQYQVDQIGAGVVAFVTPSSYLDGLTHRRMRESLLASFDELALLDLRGDEMLSSRARRAVGASAQAGAADDVDENVFGVRQGVVAAVLVKAPRRRGVRAWGAELRGGREAKLATLERYSRGDPVDWRPLAPTPPRFSLRAGHAAIGADWPGLDELVREYRSGVQTKCDALFLDVDRETLSERISELLAGRVRRSAPTWLATRLVGAVFDESRIVRCRIAPFELRWLYYDPQLLGRARWETMRHLIAGGRGLVFMRQAPDAAPYDHFLMCGELVTDRVFHSRRGAPFVAPLRLAADEGQVNLTPHAWRLCGESPRDVRPAEELWHYLYAVAHSHEYRRRLAPELRVGFPRFPPCPDRSVRMALCELGRELMELHSGVGASLAGESAGDWRAGTPIGAMVERGFPQFAPSQPAPPSPLPAPRFPNPAPRSPNPAPRTPNPAPRTPNPQIAVRLNRDGAHVEVPAEAWEWTVGGLPILAHWLVVRRGVKLGDLEWQEWWRLVRVATETRVAMGSIDGWIAQAGLLACDNSNPHLS